MQIIKLAAGRQIIIDITIDSATGEMDAKVVGNANGEGCASNSEEDLNRQLLKDLMEAEIPDFGGMDILGEGLTQEGFANKEKSRTKPTYNPLKGPASPSKPGSPVKKKPIPEGQIDTGLGV